MNALRAEAAAFFVIFALLAFGTGYTVFETFSPTGILSRALIYGPGLALFWVAFMGDLCDDLAPALPASG